MKIFVSFILLIILITLPSAMSMPMMNCTAICTPLTSPITINGRSCWGAPNKPAAEEFISVNGGDGSKWGAVACGVQKQASGDVFLHISDFTQKINMSNGAITFKLNVSEAITNSDKFELRLMAEKVLIEFAPRDNLIAIGIESNPNVRWVQNGDLYPNSYPTLPLGFTETITVDAYWQRLSEAYISVQVFINKFLSINATVNIARQNIDYTSFRIDGTQQITPPAYARFRIASVAFSNQTQTVGYTPPFRVSQVQRTYANRKDPFIASELADTEFDHVTQGFAPKTNQPNDINVYYGHEGLNAYNFTVTYGSGLGTSDTRQIFVKNQKLFDQNTPYANMDAIGVRVFRVGTDTLACIGPVNNNTKEFGQCISLHTTEANTLRLMALDNKFAFVVNPGTATERVALTYIHPDNTYAYGGAGITFFSVGNQDWVSGVQLVNAANDTNLNPILQPASGITNGNLIPIADGTDFSTFIPFRTFGTDPKVEYLATGGGSIKVSGTQPTRALSVIPNIRDFSLKSKIQGLGFDSQKLDPFVVTMRAQGGFDAGVSFVFHQLSLSGPMVTYWELRERVDNTNIVQRQNIRYFPRQSTATEVFQFRAIGDHYEVLMNDANPVLLSDFDTKKYTTGGMAMEFRDSLYVQSLQAATTPFVSSNPPTFPNLLYKTKFAAEAELQLNTFYPPSTNTAWSVFPLPDSGNTNFAWKANVSDTCMSFGPDRIPSFELRFSLPKLNNFEVGLFSNETCGRAYGILFAKVGSKFGTVCLHESSGNSMSQSLPACLNAADFGRLNSFQDFVNASDITIKVNTSTIDPGMGNTENQRENTTIIVYHNMHKITEFNVHGEPGQKISGGFYFKTYDTQGAVNTFWTGHADDNYQMILKTDPQPVLERRFPLLLSDGFDSVSFFWTPLHSNNEWQMDGDGLLVHKGNRTYQQNGPFDALSTGDPTWSDYTFSANWGGTFGANNAKPMFMIRSQGCKQGIALIINSANESAHAALIQNDMSVPITEELPFYFFDRHQPQCDGIPCNVSSVNTTVYANAWNRSIEIYATSFLIFKGMVDKQFSYGQVCLGVNNTVPQETHSTYFKKVEVECGVKFIDVNEMTLEVEAGADPLVIKAGAASTNNVCSFFDLSNAVVVRLTDSPPFNHTDTPAGLVTKPAANDGTPRVEYKVLPENLPTQAGHYRFALLFGNGVPAFNSGFKISITPAPAVLNKTTIITNAIAPSIKAGDPLGYVSLQLWDAFNNKAKGHPTYQAVLTANGMILVTGQNVHANQINITVPPLKLNNTGEYIMEIRFADPQNTKIASFLPNTTVSPLNATAQNSFMTVNMLHPLLAGTSFQDIGVTLRDPFNNPSTMFKSITFVKVPQLSANYTLNYPGQTQHNLARISVTATLANIYTLAVKLDGVFINSPPINVTFIPLTRAYPSFSQPINLPLPNLIAGQTATYDVQLKDKFGNKLLNASHYLQTFPGEFVPEVWRNEGGVNYSPGPWFELTDFKLFPIHDGIVRTTFVPKISAGAWEAKATIDTNGNRTQILNAKQWFFVRPAQLSLSNTTIDFGFVANQRLRAGRPFHLNATFHDLYGNKLIDMVSMPPPITVHANPLKNGKFFTAWNRIDNSSFVLNMNHTAKGDYNLLFRNSSGVNGHIIQLPASNFPFIIASADPFLPNYDIFGQGIQKCDVGVQNTIEIKQRDQFNNVIVKNDAVALNPGNFSLTLEDDIHYRQNFTNGVSPLQGLGGQKVIMSYYVNHTGHFSIRVWSRLESNIVGPTIQYDVECHHAQFVPENTLIWKLQTQSVAGNIFTPVRLQLRDEFLNNVTNASLVLGDPFQGLAVPFNAQKRPPCAMTSVPGMPGQYQLHCNFTSANTQQSLFGLKIFKGVQEIATLSSFILVNASLPHAPHSLIDFQPSNYYRVGTTYIARARARDIYYNPTAPRANFTFIQGGPGPLVSSNVPGPDPFSSNEWQNVTLALSIRGVYNFTIYLGDDLAMVSDSITFGSVGLVDEAKSELKLINTIVSADKYTQMESFSRDKFNNPIGPIVPDLIDPQTSNVTYTNWDTGDKFVTPTSGAELWLVVFQTGLNSFRFDAKINVTGSYTVEMVYAILGPLRGVLTNNFTVVAGAVSTSRSVVQLMNPIGTTAGGPIFVAGVPIETRLTKRDQYDNIATNDHRIVTAASVFIAQGGGSNVLTNAANLTSVQGNSLYRGNLTVTKAAVYALTVRAWNVSQGMEGADMLNFPAKPFTVLPARADGPNSRLLSNISAQTIVAGNSFSMQIQVLDLYGNNYTTSDNSRLKILSSFDATSPVFSKQGTLPSSGPFVTVTDTLTVAANYMVSLRVQDFSITTDLAGSPYPIVVHPAAPDTKNFVYTASGYSQANQVEAGIKVTHFVVAKDAFENIIPTLPDNAIDWQIPNADPQGTNAGKFTHLTNGTFVYDRIYTRTGTFTLRVLFQGTPLVVNPNGNNPAQRVQYQFTVLPSAINATRSFVVSSNVLSLEAGQQITNYLFIHARDRFGNRRDNLNDLFDVTFTHQNNAAGNVVRRATYTGSKNVYKTFATATLAGNYTVTVNIFDSQTNQPSDPIGKSYNLWVYPAEASSTNSRVFSTDLNNIVAGDPGNFTIEARDQYDNQKTVGGETFVAEANLANTNLRYNFRLTDLSNGYYQASSTVTQAGTYSVTVGYSTITNTIQGSPQTWTVVPHPVPAVQSSTVTGLDTAVVAGVSRTVIVSTFDKYGNPLDIDSTRVTMSSSTANTGGSITPKTTTHNLNFMETGTGVYTITIRVDNILIEQSMSLTVIPGPISAPNCVISGTGFIGDVGLVSASHTFRIQAKDQYNNNLQSTGSVNDFSVILTAPGINQVTPTDIALGNGNGIYDVTYRVVTPSTYVVNVKYNNLDVGNNPNTQVTIWADCAPGTARPGDRFVCVDCAINTYTNSSNEETCTACPEGSSAPEKSTALGDCACKVGFYRPAAADQNTVCQACPIGANCGGGTAQPVASPGFWAAGANQNGLQFLRCQTAEACPGGTASATCGVGYTGRLCGLCDKRYYKLQNQCVECGDDSNIVFTIACVMVLVFAIGLRKFGSEAKKLSFLGIATNNLQLMSLLGSFNLAWPSQVTFFFDLISTFNFNFELTSPECVVDVSYWDKWYFKLAAPLMLMVVLGFVQVLAWLFDISRIEYRMWRKRVKQRSINGNPEMFPMGNYDSKAIWLRNWDTTYNAFVLFLALVYALVTPTALEMFVCTQQPDNTYSLDASPSIECFNDQWYSALPATIAACIFYGIGIPAFLFWRLHVNRDRLSTEKMERRMGSVFLRYKPKFYYWEVVLVLRKGLVFFCRVLFGQYIVFQVVAAFMLILFCLEFQLYARPFASSGANLLEFASLMSSLFLLMTGLLFFGQKFSNTESFEAVVVLAIVAIVFNAITLSVGVYNHFKAKKLQTISREKSNMLKAKIAKKGQADALSANMLKRNAISEQSSLLTNQEIKHVADMIMSQDTISDNAMEKIQAILQEPTEQDDADGVGASKDKDISAIRAAASAGKGTIKQRRATMAARRQANSVFGAEAVKTAGGTFGRKHFKKATAVHDDIIELKLRGDVGDDHLSEIANFYKGLDTPSPAEQKPASSTMAARLLDRRRRTGTVKKTALESMFDKPKAKKRLDEDIPEQEEPKEEAEEEEEEEEVEEEEEEEEEEEDEFDSDDDEFDDLPDLPDLPPNQQ